MNNELPNFDTLLRIAKQDPEQLEQIRIQLAQQTISQAPEHLRPRLRGLQFQIDIKRKLAKTPLAACIQLSNMMHRSFMELCETVHRPIIGDSARRQNEHLSEAEILTFRGS